jgi:membrane protease YdiL (CAAX protease family)
MAMPAERYDATGYTDTRQWWPGYLIAALVLFIGMVAGVVFEGTIGQFMLAGMQVLPFAVLAIFAYLGVRHVWARVIAFIYLGVLLLGIGFVAMLMLLGMILLAMGMAGTADPSLLLGALASPAFIGVTLWSIAGVLVAGLMLIPALRAMVARILPIDPRSSVHAIALSLVVGATIICFGQLIAAGGLPPLLEMVEAMPDVASQTSDLDQLLLIVYGFVWTVPGALIAVGFPMVRTVPGALRRLGFVKPTARQVIAALVIAVVLVAAAFALDAAIARIWETLGWPRTDSAAFEQMLGALISPIGAVLIGITAGVGEELVVRGALQPRMGILLSNLFFTGLHAFQYGFDALLSVFIVGLVLGIVRARSNTTTSSIVHGVYDFILVLISALGLFGAADS